MAKMKVLGLMSSAKKERKGKKHKKRLEDLTICDDFMFGAVMSNPNNVKPLLEMILDVKIDHVEYAGKQRVIDLTYEGRGVRLDVYVADENGTVYNVEMQTSNKLNEKKRSRYYQGQIDMDHLRKGADFKDLPNSYVIFICTFDVFEKGRWKYTFENTCEEVPGLKLNDGTKKVFVNTASAADDIPAEVRCFFDYANSGKTLSKYTRQIDAAVKSVKNSKKWRGKFMRYRLKLMEERDEGIEIGTSITTKVLRYMYRNGHGDEADRLGDDVSHADIEALAEKYNIK